jgi:hypothetical protein
VPRRSVLGVTPLDTSWVAGATTFDPNFSAPFTRVVPRNFVLPSQSVLSNTLTMYDQIVLSLICAFGTVAAASLRRKICFFCREAWRVFSAPYSR